MTRTKQPVKVHDRSPRRQPPQQAPGQPFGWRWVVPVACLLLTAGTTWAVLEFAVWSRIPHNLAGKWVVEGGEQDGATFDFFRNGTMVGRINMRGKEGRIDARVRVEGDTLLSMTRNPHTGKDETRRQTITLLTGQELVIRDERGQVLRLTRAD
jgi:uncharacterized protein (TIGR03066 family)